MAPWRPDLLATGGIGGVIALTIAGYLGFETTAAFSEEARTQRSVGRATLAGLVFMGGFYALSAWALAVAVGPDRIVAVARDPHSGIPFSLLATHLGPAGPAATAAGLTLLAGSVLGAMIALHQVVARYLHALGREHVLPAALAALGGRHPGAGGTRRAGVPTAGSAAQSALALAAIVAAALTGVDPFGLFTALATLAALGLLALMATTCLAVIGYYRPRGGHQRGGRPHTLGAPGDIGGGAWPPPLARPHQHPTPGPERRGAVDGPGWWVRAGAPGLGALALTAALALTLANLADALADPTGVLPVLLPALIAATALAGAYRARWLRRRYRLIWNGIGHGQPPPFAVRDPAIADLEL